MLRKKNQSQKLKVIEEKYQLIADKTGIKAQYEKMAIVNNKKKFIANETAEQNFRAVELSTDERFIVKRKDMTITANKLLNTHNGTCQTKLP